MNKAKKYIHGVKWIPCDLTFVQTLSSFSGCPGQVFEGDISSLPEGIRNGMDGLSDLHISGYMDRQTIESNSLSAGGEFVIGRKDVDEARHKNYAFAIGVDCDNDLYYTGPFKYFDAHHQSLSAVDIDAAFGQIKFDNPL